MSKLLPDVRRAGIYAVPGASLTLALLLLILSPAGCSGGPWPNSSVGVHLFLTFDSQVAAADIQDLRACRAVPPPFPLTRLSYLPVVMLQRQPVIFPANGRCTGCIPGLASVRTANTPVCYGSPCAFGSAPAAATAEKAQYATRFVACLHRGHYPCTPLISCCRPALWERGRAGISRICDVSTLLYISLHDICSPRIHLMPRNLHFTWFFFSCRYDFVWGAEPSHLDEWHTARPGIVLSNYIPFARDPNTTLRGPSGLRWVYVGAQLLVR